eukprot:CFRG2146T1
MPLVDSEDEIGSHPALPPPVRDITVLERHQFEPNLPYAVSEDNVYDFNSLSSKRTSTRVGTSAVRGGIPSASRNGRGLYTPFINNRYQAAENAAELEIGMEWDKGRPGKLHVRISAAYAFVDTPWKSHVLGKKFSISGGSTSTTGTPGSRLNATSKRAFSRSSLQPDIGSVSNISIYSHSPNVPQSPSEHVQAIGKRKGSSLAKRNIDSSTEEDIMEFMSDDDDMGVSEYSLSSSDEEFEPAAFRIKVFITNKASGTVKTGLTSKAVCQSGTIVNEASTKGILYTPKWGDVLTLDVDLSNEIVESNQESVTRFKSKSLTTLPLRNNLNLAPLSTTVNVDNPANAQIDIPKAKDTAFDTTGSLDDIIAVTHSTLVGVSETKQMNRSNFRTSLQGPHPGTPAIPETGTIKRSQSTGVLQAVVDHRGPSYGSKSILRGSSNQGNGFHTNMSSTSSATPRKDSRGRTQTQPYSLRRHNSSSYGVFASGSVGDMEDVTEMHSMSRFNRISSGFSRHGNGSKTSTGVNTNVRALSMSACDTSNTIGEGYGASLDVGVGGHLSSGYESADEEEDVDTNVSIATHDSVGDSLSESMVEVNELARHHTTSYLRRNGSAVNVTATNVKPKDTRSDLLQDYVCFVLYHGEVPVSELSFPFKSLVQVRPELTWYTMTKAVKTHINLLRRAERKTHSKLSSEFWDRENAEIDQTGSVRKLISLRNIFLILIFFQVLLTIVISVIVLFQVAFLQLNQLAISISEMVSNNVLEQIAGHFTAILVSTISTASAMTFDSWNATLFLNMIVQNYRASVAQGIQDLNTFSGREMHVGHSGGEIIGSGSLFTANLSAVAAMLANNESAYYNTMPVYDKDWHPYNYTIASYAANLSCRPFENCPLSDYNDVVNATQNFDIRTRPWFQSCNETAGVTVWSKIYPFYTFEGLGITATRRVPGDLNVSEFVCVSNDITLDALSDRMAQLNYYKTGFGFIYETDTFELIASSAINTSIVSDGNRVLIDSVANAHISTVGGFIMNLHTYSPDQLVSHDSPGMPIPFYYDGSIITVAYYVAPGIQWGVVTSIPMNDFTESFLSTLIVIGLIVGAVLFLTLIVALIINQIISGQLSRITKQLSDFSRLDFSSKISQSGLRHPVREIARVYQAMYGMKLSLRSFSKYVPPDIVKILVETGAEAELGGVKRELTIFFCDIVDFTSLTETIELDIIVALLSEYLQDMSQVIAETEGVVDKYIGDGIMALWNAPYTVIDHASKCCEAALLCKARLSTLKDDWEKRGYPKINIRIGIHTGSAIVGNFGSVDRLSYTALGDNVNLASRLEGLNKEYHTSIIISEDTKDRIGGWFITRPLDVVAVKGKERAVKVYELVSHVDIATQDEMDNAYSYTNGFNLYMERNFEDAAVIFTEYLTRIPGDKAAEIHLKSCRQYMINPPDDSWDGTRRMDTK